MSRQVDVTALVRIGDNPDDTQLPITQCVCGATFQRWQCSLSSEAADLMPCCGRRLTWTQTITVIEVLDEDGR